MTTLAKLYVLPHAAHYFTKMENVFGILFQQVKDQTESCFFANSGQFSKLINRIFQERRGELHRLQMY
jgi:hypothetical protein